VGNRVLIVAIAVLAVTGRGMAAPAAVAGPTGRVVGTVRVTDPGGAQIPAQSGADVIVYVVGFSEPAGKDVTTIEQKGRKFVPDLIAITVGEKVSFPNEDPFLHNVFSQSPPRKFDLGSFKKGDSKDRTFPDLGVIDVYCNIHPEMAATTFAPEAMASSSSRACPPGTGPCSRTHGARSNLRSRRSR
jgi:plastocyanin